MFQGFTDETFEFFMAIKFNNNMEFFHSNHDWYVRAVRGPALELAAELSDIIEMLDDDLERRPNKVVSRINRDIRFSRDKSPYRDYIWLAFRRPGTRHSTTLGVYFDISADGASYGMGFYDENRPMMDAHRRSLEADAEGFMKLWDDIKDEFTLFPKSFKRMKIPETIPENARVWYNLKGFYVEKELNDFNLLKSPELAQELIAGFGKLIPMYRYFCNIAPDEGGEE